MAVIRPFTGLRYSAEAGPLDALTAPPYDVLSPAERDGYAVRNPHNVVHLTLPEQKGDDRSKYVKYARSAALLADWRRQGVLIPEDRPAFYRYEQTFSVGSHALTRTSVIALIKTEPYEKGVVLPHEQTFPKHKEDRLRILEATRAHLECIFGLFEDPGGAIHRAIVEAPAETAVETSSDDGVKQRLEPITDPAAVQALTEMMADKKVWIADGHHRYETACTFREGLGPKDGLIAEDFMMMALSSMSDPGLVLLPTHRIIAKLPIDTVTLLERLEQHFDVHETHSRNVMEEIHRLGEQGKQAFGLALEGGLGYVLVSKDREALRKEVESDGSLDLKSLDVTILHSVILEKLIGLQGLDLITYTRDSYEATRVVNEGSAAAFLMNPPTVDDMKRIALGGDKMPQKSTYYFPKILSGMVLWSLNDFAQ